MYLIEIHCCIDKRTHNFVKPKTKEERKKKTLSSQIKSNQRINKSKSKKLKERQERRGDQNDGQRERISSEWLMIGGEKRIREVVMEK